MKFLSRSIGEQVLERLNNAIEARVAVAYFKPSPEMLKALAGVNNLKLIISEEFRFNDPYQLDELRKLPNVKLKSIPRFCAEGKLHAKVIILKMKDGSCWTLLGSANLTGGGMSSNQEACVTLESGRPEERASVRQMLTWFDSVFYRARKPNLEEAKHIWDERPQYGPEPTISDEPGRVAQCWALKTTSGAGGEDHWPMFCAEPNVIAIGWERLRIDPSKVSDSDLCGAIRKGYPEYSTRQVKIAAATIRKFVDMQVGERVLVCRGYVANQKKDVHIYGFAKVTGPFRAETQKNGDWRFKHDAQIRRVELDRSRASVALALRKKSLRQTIHVLTKPSFDRLVKNLKETGASIDF